MAGARWPPLLQTTSEYVIICLGDDLVPTKAKPLTDPQHFTDIYMRHPASVSQHHNAIKYIVVVLRGLQVKASVMIMAWQLIDNYFNIYINSKLVSYKDNKNS